MRFCEEQTFVPPEGLPTRRGCRAVVSVMGAKILISPLCFGHRRYGLKHALASAPMNQRALWLSLYGGGGDPPIEGLSLGYPRARVGVCPCTKLQQGSGEPVIQRISVYGSIAMMKKLFATWLIALGCLVSFAAFAAEPEPSGKVSISSKSVAVGVGVSWGDGTLTYGSKTYTFSLQGLSVLDLGISTIT